MDIRSQFQKFNDYKLNYLYLGVFLVLILSTVLLSLSYRNINNHKSKQLSQETNRNDLIVTDNDSLDNQEKGKPPLIQKELNTPPVFVTAPQELYANIGELFGIVVVAEDEQNDEIYFGIGDCKIAEGSMIECIPVTDSNLKYTRIDKYSGWLYFIPTTDGTFTIPVWISDGKDITKRELAIRTGYDIGSPWSDKLGITENPFISEENCTSVVGNPKVLSFNPFTCRIDRYQAHGNIKVGVIQFMLADTYSPEFFGKTYYEYLKERNPYTDICVYRVENDIPTCQEDNSHKNKILSYEYMNYYLKEQAKTYNVFDLALDIDIFGPFEIDSIDRVGVNVAPEQRGATRAQMGKFRTEALSRNIDLAKYDILMMVFFDDIQDPLSNRTPKKVAFNSSVYVEERIIMIDDLSSAARYYNSIDDVYGLDLSDAEDLIATGVHEILHILGATDKYTVLGENSFSSKCNINGFGDPNKDPLYPQDTVDIMCGGNIPISETDGMGTKISDGKTIINQVTAQEIGW